MSAPLPALVDRKTLAEELGVRRSTIDAIFRAIAQEGGVVVYPGTRKPLVRRADVERLTAASTFIDGRAVRT